MPRTTMINGVEVREQTLDEYMAALPNGHGAMAELVNLRNELLKRDETIDELRQSVRNLQRRIADSIGPQVEAQAEQGQPGGKLVSKPRNIREKSPGPGQ